MGYRFEYDVNFHRDQPVAEDDNRFIVYMMVTSLNESLLQRTMAKSAPVIMKGLQHQFQGNWGPEYFAERFGSHRATVVDCVTGRQQPSTVARFFGTLISPDQQEGKIFCLKDWPPTRNFRDVCPNFTSLSSRGPRSPDYVRPDGIHNLVSHFPRNGVIPDLGPKMYSANGNASHHLIHGSTRLHLGVASSVNIMLYASDLEDGQPGFALWHIFPPSTIPRLHVFMESEPAIDLSQAGDPIQNDSTYLTQPLLQLLFDRCGVQPYTLHQFPGEAIFIPAGCAYQVSERTSAIQITCDFLRVEDILMSARLAAEFRVQRLSQNQPEDVLQLDVTMWHAWNSSCRLMDSVSAIHQREAERRRAKNRKRKVMRLLKYKDNCHFHCPGCPDGGVLFTKHGVMCHLAEKHAVVIDKKTKRALAELDTDEFHAKLWERMEISGSH